MRKMLDAGCWMLDAGKRFYTQHPATSSKEERCESLRAYSVVSGS
jgi:hypothetical protein